MTIIKEKVFAFWQLTRPHTIIGTTVSGTALFFIAARRPAATGLDFPLLAVTLFIAWLANIYIVALNQITDIEIDRLNKPYLPLPSGRLSMKSARIITALSGTGAILLSLRQDIFLFIVIIGSVILGTLYSVPPVRLRRFSFWASFCIFSVRGILINLGVYLHFGQKLGTKPGIPPEIISLTLFILLLSLVIAWYKDIPDITGDRQFNLRSLAISIGPEIVLKIGNGMITAGYFLLIVSALFALPSIQTGFFIASHFIIWIVFQRRCRNIPIGDRDLFSRFYRFIWKLFYLEYIVFAAAVWINF